MGKMNQQVAQRDTTFDGMIPERVWLLSDNFTRKDYLTLWIEINGIKKILVQYYIPGLDPREGVLVESQNLTWIIEAVKESQAKGDET